MISCRVSATCPADMLEGSKKAIHTTLSRQCRFKLQESGPEWSVLGLFKFSTMGLKTILVMTISIPYAQENTPKSL